MKPKTYIHQLPLSVPAAYSSQSINVYGFAFKPGRLGATLGVDKLRSYHWRVPWKQILKCEPTNPRYWGLTEFGFAAGLALILSWGFIAQFPYDRVMLGPLQGFGGYSLLLGLVVVISWQTWLCRANSLGRKILGGASALLVGLSLVLIRVIWTPRIDPLADRDEALATAWRGLVEGIGPYSQPTPQGNPISPLLGGVLLYGPVDALGLAEFYDVLAFAICFAVGLLYLGIRPLLGIFTIWGATAATRWEIAIQSDGWINAALVAISALTFWHFLNARRGSARYLTALVLASLLLILCVSYRAQYLLVFLPLIVIVFKRWGWSEQLLATASSGLLALLLSGLPLVLGNTAHGPLHVSDVFDPMDSMPLAWVLLALFFAICLYCLRFVVSISGAFMWTVLSSLGPIAAIGLVQIDWGTFASTPAQFIMQYPPPILEPFGQYALTAHNSGLLLLGLVSLVLPKGSSPKNGRPTRVE